MLDEIIIFISILVSSVGIIVSSWNIYNAFLAIYGIKWNKKGTKNHSDKTFSIIIPAKDEEKVLGRLLNRLVNQEYDKSKYEIIVAIDSSTDNTYQICKQYENLYSNLIRCIDLPKPEQKVPNGKSRALNYAMKIAKYEIIGIFDADTFPRLDVLSYASSAFDDPQVAGVQGKLIPINIKENIITRLASFEELYYEYSIAGRARLGLFVPIEGTCSFIRKSAIQEVGGWNEYSLTEDLDLSIKLVAKGYKIVYVPSIIAWREVVTNLRWLIRQRLRWYRGHVETIQRLKWIKIDLRTIDGILIVLVPMFVVLNLVNYFLILVYPIFLKVVATIFAYAALFLTFMAALAISKRHIIECPWRPWKDLRRSSLQAKALRAVSKFLCLILLLAVYMNFLLLLHIIALSLEAGKRRRIWIKTIRSGKITEQVE